MATFRFSGGLYLDTSIVIASLFPGTPNADACSAFTEEIRSGRITVHFSQVLRIDFARAIRRLANRPDRLPPELVDEHRLREWQRNPLLRQLWYVRCARMLEGYFAQFPALWELPLTQDVWWRSMQIMGSESLEATDAVHLASAQLFGVRHFATADADFSRVSTPTIHLIRDRTGDFSDS